MGGAYGPNVTLETAAQECAPLQAPDNTVPHTLQRAVCLIGSGTAHFENPLSGHRRT
jgi:hypothetical protein